MNFVKYRFYEFGNYCNAGVVTAVGEAKVRAGEMWRRRINESSHCYKNGQTRSPANPSQHSTHTSQSPPPHKRRRRSRCG